ncbi:head-tail connector protein [Devosia beringensis]|uniref:head-tail connector protein n=1 Tax=Devosia beringensis TaxID=2657486 RepID=UPI00186B7C86|nr:head-tail connector protein [Devosia beringensis]
MIAPILVTPPEILPVSLEEAKLHLRVEDNDEDTLINALLRAAVSHLDGWTGVLGRCLVEQTWRLDFDTFGRCMRLPLWPIIEIESITWRNEAGQVATIGDSNYALRSDERGAYVYWDRAYGSPSGLYESAAVSVQVKAGYSTTPAVEADPEAEPPVEAVPAVSTVPAALKVAILLLVGTWFDNREATVSGNSSELPFAVNALIAPFRRISI